jgi:Heterokaryon incompatibility protein (HET)
VGRKTRFSLYEESKGYLPSRLVDVWGYENGVICLVSTAKFPKGAVEYLALSHCWAAKVKVKLARADSLCIVQDDEKECEIQSTCMGLIYAKVRCVTSATTSKDAEDGCYQLRDLWRSTLVLCEEGDE